MKRIFGYYFLIKSRKAESGFVAFVPGIGGVYEEGDTEEDARINAYEAACAIIEMRLANNSSITEDNQYLRVLTAPPNMNYIRTFKNPANGYITTGSCMEIKDKEYSLIK